MKKTVAVVLALGVCVLFTSCDALKKSGCSTGAFLADKPTAAAIKKFAVDYGKRPVLILIFLDWGMFPDEAVVRDVYNSGSILVVTWEPWHAEEKKAIDFPALLAGKDDAYVREFALKLKAIDRLVLLRFAHEMNGDWYPWSGKKIGKDIYAGMFRHIRDVFNEAGVRNVRWVFSINAENVPTENVYTEYYPGSPYVDYIGLDGYNWGTTQSWSRWRSFKEIFHGVYEDVVRRYKKPVILTEFSSTSAGGNKALWIEDALREIKKMPKVKGFILFNIDKETDWWFPPAALSGRGLKTGLEDPYFLEMKRGDF